MPPPEHPPDEPSHAPLPPRVVVAAFLLAAVSALVPAAIVGALFAGIVLARRGRPGAGAAVVALGVAATALGIVLLR